MPAVLLAPLAFVRNIQTDAASTKLRSKPSDLFEPLTVRLHEDLFWSHLCETPDLGAGDQGQAADDALHGYCQVRFTF